MRLEHGERSDVGRTRSGNEDSFLIDDSIALYVVADGMGGHRAGEVASATAVSALRASMTPSQPITAAVAQANAAVYAKAGLDPELLGMGTTVTAAVLSGNQCYIAHVGDSRCYMLREGQLTRLTFDHSFVEQLVRDGQLTPEQAAVHPKRSILTRALGIDERVEIDHYVVTVQPGDRLLLCSDGLTGMVREDGIAQLLTESASPQEAADRLIDAANANGGEDNITAVVVDVVDDGTDGLPAVYLTEPPTDTVPTARVIAVPPSPGTYADGPTIETDPTEAAQAVRDAMSTVAALEARGDAPDAAAPDAGGPFSVPEPRVDPAFPAPQGFDDATFDAGASAVPVALADPAQPAFAPLPGPGPGEPAPSSRPTWVVPAIVAGVVVVVVLIVVLVLVSGSDDDDGTDEPAPTTTSTAAVTTTTAGTTTTASSTTASTTATTAGSGTATTSAAGSTPTTRVTATTAAGAEPNASTTQG